MNTIKHILSAILLVGVSTYGMAESDTKEEELISIIESSKELSFEMPAFEQKIFVYDLDGRLVLESDRDELNEQDFKILFQSDLMMETAGSEYYIMDKNELILN